MYGYLHDSQGDLIRKASKDELRQSLIAAGGPHGPGEGWFIPEGLHCAHYVQGESEEGSREAWDDLANGFSHLECDTCGSELDSTGTCLNDLCDLNYEGGDPGYGYDSDRHDNVD